MDGTFLEGFLLFGFALGSGGIDGAFAVFGHGLYPGLTGDCDKF